MVLAFFFLAVGSHSIERLLQDPDFVSDCIFTVVVIFALLRFLGWLNYFLSDRYSWQRPFTQRLLLQLTGGTVLPSLLIWISVYCYRAFVLRMPDLEMQYFNANEFPIGVLVLIFTNFTFIGYSFYIESKLKGDALVVLQRELYTLQNIQQEQSVTEPILADNDQQQKGVQYTAEESRVPVRLLIAFSGNKNIPLHVEDVAYIYKQGMYIQLRTFKNETYLLNHSLEEVMQLLNDELFFRANRQFIINLKSCQFFTNEENGKLALHLLPAYEEDDIIISQKRASSFKEWLGR